MGFGGGWNVKRIVDAVVDCVICRLITAYDIRMETEVVGGKFITRITVEDQRDKEELERTRSVLIQT